MSLTPRQITLLDYSGKSDDAYATLLGQNYGVFSNFFKKYYPNLDFDLMIETFRGDNQNLKKEALDFIADCVGCSIGKIPTDKIRFPINLERKIARQESVINFRKAFDTARDAFYKIGSFSPIKLTVGLGQLLIKAPAEAYAGVTGAMGLLKRERQLLLANIVGVSALSNISSISGFFVASATVAGTLGASLDDATAAVPTHTQPAALTQTESRLSYVSTNASLGADQIAAVLADHFDQRSATLQNETGLSSPYLYSPFLVRQLETDMKAREYVAKLTEAAKRCDLDPVLFVNQMYKESWSFNPRYIYGPDKSSADAMGLTQIIASTGARYGLKKTSDFFDVDKSINAGADIMCDLTEKYGDQIVATFAYNGGDGAVLYPMKELGVQTITGEQVKAFYEEMRRLHGPGDITKWRNQSYGYAREIDGTGWEPAHMKWAQQQQRNGLPQHMTFIAKIIPNFSIGKNQSQAARMTMVDQPRQNPS